MKKLILILLILFPTIVNGQQYQLAARLSYLLTSLPSTDPKVPETLYESLIGRKMGVEYTIVFDKYRRYNGNMIGLSTGLHAKYENFNLNDFDQSSNYNNKSIQIPVLFAVKENEWNNVYKVGFVYQYDYETNIIGIPKWDINPNHLNLYASIGFDNEPYSYRRDWSYYIGAFGEYSITSYLRNEEIRVLNWGITVGVSYIFDWYHYRGNTKNKPFNNQ
jgi:hypothetical protein